MWCLRCVSISNCVPLCSIMLTFICLPCQHTSPRPIAAIADGFQEGVQHTLRARETTRDRGHPFRRLSSCNLLLPQPIEPRQSVLLLPLLSILPCDQGFTEEAKSRKQINVGTSSPTHPAVLIDDMTLDTADVADTPRLFCLSSAAVRRRTITWIQQYFRRAVSRTVHANIYELARDKTVSIDGNYCTTTVWVL